MLVSYKNSQEKAYNVLTKQLINNKCSHAYLFNTNNYEYANDFIFSFVKSLYCNNHNIDNNNCKDCHICENIDKNISPEIKIIQADGMWIKKEQLLELKKEFSTKAVNSNKKIYIIKEADKLNSSSANTILKFLEEPEENIYAILITDNVHKIIDTIKSRCQVINLVNRNQNDNKIEQIRNIIMSNKSDEEISNIIDKTIDFIYSLNRNHENTILYTKELIFDNFTTNQDIKDLLGIMELYYKDLIDYKIKGKTTYFSDKMIEDIATKNTLKQLIDKLNVIITQIEKVGFNTNINLLIDKLIIDMEVS